MSSSAREEWHLSPIESPEMNTVGHGANPTPGWRLGGVALTDPLVHLGMSPVGACSLHRERRNSKVSFYPLGVVAGEEWGLALFDDRGPGGGLIAEIATDRSAHQRFCSAAAALVRRHRLESLALVVGGIGGRGRHELGRRESPRQGEQS